MFDVIVLAGGFGTRLKEVVSDVPKPMAPINNRPFLEYLLNHLIEFDIKRIVLAIGYKGGAIKNYFGELFASHQIIYSTEEKPLGTGGAILQAIQFTNTTDVLVLNGDSLFKFDMDNFYRSHLAVNSNLTIALKQVNNTARYGGVRLGENNIITDFIEKISQPKNEIGLINSGCYFIKTEWINSLNLPEVFSFEKDILEKFVKFNTIKGFTYEGYFIDIGIPEDYQRAQEELK